MLNEKSCPLWWFTGVSVCVLTGVIYRSHNLQPAVKCNMEGSRRRENHFPSYFHRNQGVKDHTHSYPLLPFSSLFSSQPFEEGIPSLGPLAFWLSDWWLHKETTSIIHWQNLSNWLCPHLPFPYNPSLMSVMMLSLFFLWIKCFFPPFIWGFGHMYDQPIFPSIPWGGERQVWKRGEAWGRENSSSKESHIREKLAELHSAWS